jgi:hypothetical protein
MGGMKAISRIMRTVNPADPTVIDFFKVLVHAGTSPYIKELIMALAAEKDHGLFWTMIQGIFDQLEQSNPDNLWRMKQLGFYSLASFSKLDPMDNHGSPRESVLDLGLWRLGQVTTDYRVFLTQHVHLFKDLITSKQIPAFLRSLYEEPSGDRHRRISNLLRGFLLDDTGRQDSNRVKNGVEIFKRIYENDEATRSLTQFRDRVDAVSNLPAYRDLRVADTIRPVLRFLEQRADERAIVPTLEEVSLANKFRFLGAKTLEEGDLDQFLSMIGRNPDNFNHVLGTASYYVNTGNLENFLKVVRRSLSETQH